MKTSFPRSIFWQKLDRLVDFSFIYEETKETFGHPLSILTAFAAAPITSLNPLLACGWFAGLVEATVKKPTVQDVMNVQTDIFSLKGFYKNRFLKTLMIVVLVNIGSSIGTFVAGTDIIRNLF